MRLTPTGNVGIGVTNPSDPLEIRRDQNASTDVTVRNSSNLANASARMLLTGDVGSGVLTYNGSGSSVSAYAGGPSGLGIWTTGSGGVALSSKSASGTLRFYTGTTPTERVRINASGFVGIGTSAPTHELEIAGSGGEEGTPGIFIQDPTTGGSGYGAFLYYDDSNGLNAVKLAAISGGAELGYIAIARSNGNVGIGTATPSATLDVNGYMKLAKNRSAPVACNSGYDGSIALTSARRMCVCDGSSWKEMNSATACTW